MAKTPQLEVHKKVVAYLTSLGLDVTGRPSKNHPVVIVDQMSVSTYIDTKDQTAYDVSFVLDVCSVSESPKEAYDTIEDIREGGIESLSYTNLDQQSFSFGECTTMQEQMETDVLWRQIQRIEITFN